MKEPNSNTQPMPFAVIMAGGAGERFWPLSRRSRPKQLLRLTRPDRTLLEEAIERIAPLIPRQRVFVATARALAGTIREANVGVPGENVLGEPCARNTAGCLVYVAAQLLARFGLERASEISLAVLTADHLIGEEERFRAAVDAALRATQAGGVLATIGVVPTRPETGYGYIEIPPHAEPLEVENASMEELPSIYPVASFREKPDRDTAEEFIGSGRFLWNSGMFFWRLDAFLEELELASPGHAAAARAMAEALAAGDETRADEIFTGLSNISIDYALMEKARRVVVVRAGFPWDDVGAWDALERSFEHDPQGNVTIGEPILIDSRGCIVYNEPGQQRMAVAAIGLEDLVVVVSGDAVLIAPKSRAQDVKKAVALLREKEARQL